MVSGSIPHLETGDSQPSLPSSEPGIQALTDGGSCQDSVSCALCSEAAFTPLLSKPVLNSAGVGVDGELPLHNFHEFDCATGVQFVEGVRESHSRRCFGQSDEGLESGRGDREAVRVVVGVHVAESEIEVCQGLVGCLGQGWMMTQTWRRIVYNTVRTGHVY